MEKVRVAIVGAGRIAEVHAEGYRRLGDKASLVAIAGAHAKRTSAKAHAWGVGKTYEGIEAVFADPEVDAVDLCLPHHLHLEAVLEACAAHKHVLLEKPIARTLKKPTTFLKPWTPPVSP